MRNKKKNIWYKHGDFILLDMICLQLAYLLAYAIRHNYGFAYQSQMYRDFAYIIVFSGIATGLLLENYKNILQRGSLVELKKTILEVSVSIMFDFTYLFVTKTSSIYSREVLLETWLFGILFIYIVRLIWKQVLRARNRANVSSMILVSSSDRVLETWAELNKKPVKEYQIRSILLIDPVKMEGIHGTPIFSGMDTNEVLQYLLRHQVDRVFIDLPWDSKEGRQLLSGCREMGVVTHYNLLTDIEYQNLTIEKVGEYLTVTSNVRLVSNRALMVKRLFDICGGLVGCAITLVLACIFGPIIYLQSPGPIFFSQKRVGRNGKIFRIYKFRSMYLDAEERKKELMEQNKMNGLMFKMDNDPRVIPIGRFMRKTSLDEFPQFWNVLKGDMSLVGTRPPTMDEYEQYARHHRARLSFQSGITGMWQINGRSNITDFEEVVRLDMKYIHEWSVGLDLRILFLTVKNMLTGEGAS
jgi:exopolysaccharide biosynthesis polyprenyl glycosylphosphotransferase